MKKFQFSAASILIEMVILGAMSAFSVSAQYIQNQTTPQAGANFNISGNGTANTFNAVSQFNINGSRILGSGPGNLFAGVNSGYNNVGGTNNSLVGYGAGYANTSGNGASFFGAYAGYNNSTGYSNSFFGSGAGYLNTTGNQNLFVGFQAGSNNSAGSDNTFVGSGSGYFNTLGYNNAFVGTSVGQNNTTGYNNTFFGRSAGLNNTTGNNNTLIGASANVWLTNLTFATAIGAGTVVTASNTIVLGRSVDKVVIPGTGTAGSSTLCRNASNQISACSSSLRYKTGIHGFSDGLSFINKLRPISYLWKDGGMKDVGFGAEDIAKIDARFVTYNDKGEVEGVKYDRMSAVFVNAFKEQQKQIESLEKANHELKTALCEMRPSLAICARQER